MSAPNPPQGRREAHKQATREALTEAARRLFAEHGYEQTTVRDIAAEAGVTERTFYRYFGDKSALVADELLAWLAELGEEIVARPASEPDLTAVEAAVLKLVRRSDRDALRLPAWFGSEPRRPLQAVRPSIPRPLLRVEHSIAVALAARAEAAGRDPDEFRDLVVARICVAVLRNALLAVRDEGGDPRPGPMVTFLKRGFAVLQEVALETAKPA